MGRLLCPVKQLQRITTMVTTADHDGREVPAHSFKFGSRLQEMQQGPAPVLIRIETKTGWTFMFGRLLYFAAVGGPFAWRFSANNFPFTYCPKPLLRARAALFLL